MLRSPSSRMRRRELESDRDVFVLRSRADRLFMIDAMHDGPFPTDVPARLDCLRWSRFHASLIAALGTIGIIDGLEVTLVGSLASVLTQPTALGLSESEVGAPALVQIST